MLKKIFLWFMKIALNYIPKNQYSLYMKQSMPYKDNVSAILDEMNKHKEYKKYKIYIHGNMLAKYENLNVYCVKPHSVCSIWHYIRSMFVLYDNGLYGSIYSHQQVSIHLTHGMLYKTFGYLTKDSFKERKDCPFLPYRTATHTIVTAPFFEKKMSLALGLPTEDVWVTGLPRNDYLKSDVLPTKLFQDICGKYKKSIIWMPTYRQSEFALSKSDGVDYELGIPLLDNNNIHILDEKLRSCNVILVIKYHTLQRKEKIDISKLTNIAFIDSDTIVAAGIALYSFVKSFDALITDYSSVFYDYLLLNKPICHIIDDFEEYESSRGFTFKNAKDLLPGLLIKDFNGIINFVNDIAQNIDIQKERRESFINIYNKYNDCQNAKRVIDKLGL